MHILLTGDLHIGRSSSGVTGITAPLRAAEAWGRIVDLALERAVAAVVVSGDLVDHSNRYFEATGPLSRGLCRLAAAGIRTIAVAGNHDHRVLADLARQYAGSGSGSGFGFTLLGAGGNWEHTVVEDPSGAALRIVGWSFPAESHTHDPLLSFPADLLRDVPVLGLIHGDLDAPNSRYAPLDRLRLAGALVQGWLLGHIHQPALSQGPGHPWILYPGTPQALDPGERGVHGVWIAEVTETGIRTPGQVPLSSVRYEQVTIDIGCASSEGELRASFDEALRRQATDARADGGEHLAALVADLLVQGTTPAAGWVDGCLTELAEAGDLEAPVPVVVRRSTNLATPALDLDGLSHGGALQAVLARLVTDLERDPDPDPTQFSADTAEVLRRSHAAVRELMPQSTLPNGDSASGIRLEYDDRTLREKVRTAARRLLAGLRVGTGDAGNGGPA